MPTVYEKAVLNIDIVFTEVKLVVACQEAF